MSATQVYECGSCHATQPTPDPYHCPRCGGIVTLQVGGLTAPQIASLDGAAPSNISELPRMFGKPDEAIRKLLNDVVALNESGQVDSIAIITTSYGHAPQIRRRIGHTGTTLLGAMMTLAHRIAAGAHETPLETDDA